MFKHILKYNLKVLYKNKMLIFWTYFFPIILGAFFYLAFNDIEKKETFEPINIAVIENSEFKNNVVWKNTIDNLSKEGSDKQIFKTTYKTLDDGKKALDKEEIVGYFVLENDKPQIVIKQNGTNETIFKSVIEEINSTSKLMEQYISEKTSYKFYENINYEAIYREALSILESENDIKDVTNNKMSYTMIEYYTLIAMACLYGGILGMVSINKNLPNMGNIGKRVAVSKVPKKILILSSALASYIVQVVGLALLFIFTIFILKVDYGSNLPLIIVLALVGAFTGLTLGIATASIIKSNENTKLGIILAITMTCCFFAGMMGITMKYVIDKNVPIINMINPAARITDGFYSLYHYNTLSRYCSDIVSLLVIAGILILVSIYSLRRQKYDSI